MWFLKKVVKDFYVNSDDALKDVVALIERAGIVALDTEFTREKTYYPILSLIQVAVKDSDNKQKTFVIDCLSKLDLSEFFSLIANPKIVKILHSSAQDLQIFHYHSELTPCNVFDTQVMANFCGFDFNVGYSSLVENLFDKKLDKKQQRSDWQRRPLSKSQLDYALLDVVFLEEIYNIFLGKLQEMQRLEWFLEEMNSFVSRSLFKKEENIFKNFYFVDKTPLEISKIKNLALWREKWAQKINIPRRHLLGDEKVSDIVVSCDLSGLNFSEEMIEEIQSLISSEEIFFENNEVLLNNDRQKACYQSAKNLINKTANKIGFKEQFLITNFDLKKIICNQNLFDETVFGWRHSLFGDKLKEIILKYTYENNSRKLEDESLI